MAGLLGFAGASVDSLLVVLQIHLFIMIFFFHSFSPKTLQPNSLKTSRTSLLFIVDQLGGDGLAFLQGIKDEGRSRIRDPLDGPDLPEEGGERVGAVDLGLDHVIKFARDPVDLLDLGDPGQLPADLGAADGFHGLDMDKGDQRHPQGLMVQADFIAQDNALLFQLLDPFQDTGRRHSDPPGQLGIGYSAVILNYIQN